MASQERASLARQGSWARIVGGFENFSIGTGRFICFQPGQASRSSQEFRSETRMSSLCRKNLPKPKNLQTFSHKPELPHCCDPARLSPQLTDHPKG